MALRFNQFSNATKEETPDFAAAAAAEGRAEQEAHARAQALRSQNMLGGAQLYNAGMGDKSPIADYLFGPEDGADTLTNVPVETRTAADSVGGSEFVPSSTPAPMQSPVGNPQMSAGPTVDPFQTMGSTGSEMGGAFNIAPELGMEAGSSLAAPAAETAALSTSAVPASTTALGGATPIASASTAAPAATGGIMSGAATAMPYVAAALAANEMFGDPEQSIDENLVDLTMDGAGALFGKGWLWS